METTLTSGAPPRILQLIRNDHVSRFDAERFVPGKVVAAADYPDYSTVVYRVGNTYIKKTVFTSPGVAERNIASWIREARLVDRNEWSALRWATRDDPKCQEKHVQEVEDVNGKSAAQSETSPRSGAELQGPPKPTPEQHGKYGHTWNEEEFRNEFTRIIERGGLLIAFDSGQETVFGAEEDTWWHRALFRTTNVSLLGNVLFLDAWVLENGKHESRTVSKHQAETRYREATVKIAELGTLVAGGARP